MENMRRINKVKGDITFRDGGMIEIRASGVKKIKLSSSSKISFFIDSENNLYIKKDSEGMPPYDTKGNYYRFQSVNVCRRVLNLPDIPEGLDKASFRIGDEENKSFPVITRILLS